VGLGTSFCGISSGRASSCISSSRSRPDGTEPLANYRTIRSELELHNAELGRRPEIVAVDEGRPARRPRGAAAIVGGHGRRGVFDIRRDGPGLNELVGRIAKNAARRAGVVGETKRRLTKYDNSTHQTALFSRNQKV